MNEELERELAQIIVVLEAQLSEFRQAIGLMTPLAWRPDDPIGMAQKVCAMVDELKAWKAAVPLDAIRMAIDPFDTNSSVWRWLDTLKPTP